MKSKLLSYWEKILSNGSNIKLDIDEHKRIRLTNIAIFLVFIINIIYGITLVPAGLPYYFAIMDFGFATIAAIAYYINKQHYFNTARSIVVLLLNVELTLVCFLFGKWAGNEFFLLPLLVFIVFAFNQKNLRLINYAVTTVCYCLIHYSYRYSKPINPLPAIESYFFPNIVISAFIIYLLLVQFLPVKK